MKLTLLFHDEGPIVSSGQCKIEDTLRTISEQRDRGESISKLMLRVEDLRTVGPLMKLLIKYRLTAQIETHDPDVSRNAKTIALQYRLGVKVIAIKP